MLKTLKKCLGPNPWLQLTFQLLLFVNFGCVLWQICPYLMFFKCWLFVIFHRARLSFNLHEWHIHARGQLRNWDLKKSIKRGKGQMEGAEEKLHKKVVLAYKGGWENICKGGPGQKEFNQILRVDGCSELGWNFYRSHK